MLYPVLLLLSLLLFMSNSWVPGFFHDGYLYAAFGKHAAEMNYWLVPHLAPETYARFDQHSPFIFMLEGALFKIIGSGFFQARLFVSLFGLGCLVYMKKWIDFVFQDKQERDEVFMWSFLFFLLSLPFIKILRFPNMDVPLAFFIFACLFYYLKEQWILMGIFFGFSLLTKGPMAVFIPITILFHIAWSKEWRRLFSPKLWSSGVLGLLMFSLWPLALYLTGQFEIFKGYIQHTFFYTMKDARGEIQNDYLLYVRHLAIFCGLHLIAFLGGARKWKRIGVSNWEALMFCAFIAILVPTSLMKFKYSHYIAPIFPFMSILAAIGAREWVKLTYNRLMRAIIVILSLAILVINLNPKARIPSRDAEIFETLNLIHSQQITMTKWYLVDDAYPFWSLVNLLGYVEYQDVKQISHLELKENIWEKKGTVVVLPLSLESSIADKPFKVISKFPKKNLLVVVSNYGQ